jgi:uncharacterized membrane protein
MFGEKVGFNMDGQPKFKTCCGATVSLAILIFCLIYFIYMLNNVITGKGNILYLTQTPSDLFQGIEQPHSS